MNILLIIASVLVYFIIGYIVLILRATENYIDNSDVAIALFMWPLILLLLLINFIGTKIRISATYFGDKMGKRYFHNKQE
jgi:multisubunit Na+/H+ antiporter MnhB subunit